MSENPVATCAANGTTIYGSHGVSSVTYSSTGIYIFNFDSTTQGYRTTSWDSCTITQAQTPSTSNVSYRMLQRYNYHSTSDQTRVAVYTTNVYYNSYFYGLRRDPGYHTLVSTSGGTQDVSECDVVGAVRFSTGATISQWTIGVTSVSDQGTGLRRVNWTSAFQANFSNYLAAAIVFQAYISGGSNTIDTVYARAAGYIDMRSMNSVGSILNPDNISLLAFKT